MGVVQLPDELKRVIDRQISSGRASSEAEFLAEAVQRYAEALDVDDGSIVAAADEGVGNMEAGRFDMIAGSQGMQSLRIELRARLDQLLERSRRDQR